LRGPARSRLTLNHHKALIDETEAKRAAALQRSKSLAEVCELLRSECDASKAALEEVRLNANRNLEAAINQVKHPSTPLEFLLVEGALHVVQVRGKALALRRAVVAELERAQQGHVPSTSIAMSAVITNTVALCELTKRCASFPKVTASLVELAEECRREALAFVLDELRKGLTKMEWGVAATAEGLLLNYWPDTAKWLDWAMTLEFFCGWKVLGQARTSEPSCLRPFWEPFRKRFVFHFLDASLATAKPGTLREACKHALRWVSNRSPFLNTQVQEMLRTQLDSGRPLIATHEMLRELSLLLTHRVKNDFALLLGGTGDTVSAESNRLFIDTVDEVFAWSRTLAEVYGYQLGDEGLPHVLLETLLPSAECPVTQHWLALERAALLGRVELQVARLIASDDGGGSAVGELLAELEVCTQQRLSVLPLAWQRKVTIHRVYSPQQQNPIVLPLTILAIHTVASSVFARPKSNGFLTILLLQAFFSAVHALMLQNLLDRILELVKGGGPRQLSGPPAEEALDESAVTATKSAQLSADPLRLLQQLHGLGAVLGEWSSRPEFDQDDGLLAALAGQCADRAKAGCRRFCRMACPVCAAHFFLPMR
jgi:hypothetical protein